VGHFRAFTSLSARRLFEAVFPGTEIRIEPRGDVLAASAILYGIAAEEFRQPELDACDPDFEVITIRAVKLPTGNGEASCGKFPRASGPLDHLRTGVCHENALSISTGLRHGTVPLSSSSSR
jgi:hypothetical protein